MFQVNTSNNLHFQQRKQHIVGNILNSTLLVNLHNEKSLQSHKENKFKNQNFYKQNIKNLNVLSIILFYEKVLASQKKSRIIKGVNCFKRKQKRDYYTLQCQTRCQCILEESITAGSNKLTNFNISQEWILAGRVKFQALKTSNKNEFTPSVFCPVCVCACTHSMCESRVASLKLQNSRSRKSQLPHGRKEHSDPRKSKKMNTILEQESGNLFRLV